MDSQESIWTHFCSSINKLVHCSYVNFAWKIFLHTFTKEVDHTFPAFSLLLLVVGGNIHLSVLCLFIQAVCNRKHCRLYGPAWLHCEALKGCLHIDLAPPNNRRQQEKSWGEEHANEHGFLFRSRKSIKAMWPESQGRLVCLLKPRCALVFKWRIL